MASRTLACPKCKGTMEQGLIADHTHHGVVRQSWLAGETSKGWLGGEKMPKGSAVMVTTWRCESCGYLESYATKSRKR